MRETDAFVPGERESLRNEIFGKNWMGFVLHRKTFKLRMILYMFAGLHNLYL